MKQVYNLRLFMLAIIISFSGVMLTSCEKDEETTPTTTGGTTGGGTTGGGTTGSAQVHFKVNMTESAHECITVTYSESTVKLIITAPDGSVFHNKAHTIRPWVDGTGTGKYEVDAVIDGFTQKGDYLFNIYDEAGTYQYETTKKENISSFDLEKSRKGSVFFSLGKSDAGC